MGEGTGRIETPRYLLPFDTASASTAKHEVIVVGTGIAGLTAALCAAKRHRVALLTKAPLMETSTWYAQGGVASATSEEDSTQLHFDDTIIAGAGLCRKEAVRVLVDEGPERIQELVRIGASFDTFQGRLRLAKEGGHSLARILHVGDTTGSAIQATLVGALHECERIEVFERSFVVDLLDEDGRCIGVLARDEAGGLVAHLSPVTVLATGGAGCVYSVTTNPDVATGDGLAAAYRAGADLADMEFVQFHPTALDTDDSPRFLITEALRGEGAVLRDATGERFMVGTHPRAELAPRDAVIQGIVRAMDRTGEDKVFLDATGIDAARLKERFPNIWEHCASVGIDLANDWVPVTPAAHYMVGGLVTDLWGRTSLPGLYASGEVASTGVHGANRLASNSLLEGLVFSKRICGAIERDENRRSSVPPSFDESPLGVPLEVAELRKLMTEDAGVKRNERSLRCVLSRLADGEPGQAPDADGTSRLEAENLTLVGRLISRSALLRTESRGVHYREDFPQTDDATWKRRIIVNSRAADRMEEVEA
ncbi:MAG: L-aspartate oxidase [Actinobacteria bacterium]|nr:MAG: L-aspartate oxidase [Actinomycetota bacterium]